MKNVGKTALYSSRRIWLLLAVSAISCRGTAQVLGQWDFNGNNNGVAGAYTTVSAATFSVGIPTKAFNGGIEYYGQDGWPAGGINLGSYMEFTLTPTAGHALDILSLTLRMRRSNTGTSGGGPNQWSIRSSLDGYTTDISTGTLALAYTNFNVTPGNPFANVAGPVTFRVYGYLFTISSGAYSRLVFDYIQVFGAGTVLPLHIVSFSGRADNRDVHFNFTLNNVQAGTRVSMERSMDGVNFSSINSWDEPMDLSAVTHDYLDNQVPSTAAKTYYRLRMQEPGTQPLYSSILSLSFEAYQRPVQVNLSGNALTLSGSIPAESELLIYSAQGSCLFRKTLAAYSSRQTLQLPVPHFPSGIYYVSIRHGREQQTIPVLAR